MQVIGTKTKFLDRNLVFAAKNREYRAKMRYKMFGTLTITMAMT
jgi:hypothetical protein